MCKQYATVGHGDETTAAALSVTTENGRQHKRLRYVRKEGGCNVLFRHVPEPWLLFHRRLPVHLETQTTIGYGFRACRRTACGHRGGDVQDAHHCVIDTFVIGIVVARCVAASARRPSASATAPWSTSPTLPVACPGVVVDFRRNHMSDIILVTPTVITHRIDSRSPLYASTMEDVAKTTSSWCVLPPTTQNTTTTGSPAPDRAPPTSPGDPVGAAVPGHDAGTRRHYRVDYSVFPHTARGCARHQRRGLRAQEAAAPSPRHSPSALPALRCAGPPRRLRPALAVHSPRHSAAPSRATLRATRRRATLRCTLRATLLGLSPPPFVCRLLASIAVCHRF
ncbi:unnamed protein product [Boreogadus saida]